MKILVTGEFRFKSLPNEILKVSWYEQEQKRKKVVNGEEVEVPLTIEELEIEYRKLFLLYKRDGRTLSVNSVLGGLAFIDLSDVFYAELTVEEVKE